MTEPESGLSRRQILQAASMAPLFGSLAVPRPLKAERVRVGAGIIGTAHAHAELYLRRILGSPDVELFGVAEPDLALLAAARQKPAWQKVPWVSVDDLLADERIRVVCIETDPLVSLPYADRSVKAGKHTKIDKPPGIDLGALERIYVEAKRRDLMVQISYQYRYDPAFRLAFRAIHEGWLGPIHSLACQINDMLAPQTRKRLDLYPGGQMYEICGHMIDALIWMMGEPERVSPVLRHVDDADDTLEDDVLAIFEFARAVAIVKSHTRDSERYFDIFGQEGSVQIDVSNRSVRLTLSKSHGEFTTGLHERSREQLGAAPTDVDDLAQAIREGRKVRYFTPEHDLLVQRSLLRACGVDV